MDVSSVCAWDKLLLASGFDMNIHIIINILELILTPVSVLYEYRYEV